MGALLLGGCLLGLGLEASGTPLDPASARSVASMTASCDRRPHVHRCDCPKHRTGSSCEKQAGWRQMRMCSKDGKLEECLQDGLFPCLNACNGRGQCMGGWCKCQRGGRARDGGAELQGYDEDDDDDDALCALPLSALQPHARRHATRMQHTCKSSWDSCGAVLVCLDRHIRATCPSPPPGGWLHMLYAV